MSLDIRDTFEDPWGIRDSDLQRRRDKCLQFAPVVSELALSIFFIPSCFKVISFNGLKRNFVANPYLSGEIIALFFILTFCLLYHFGEFVLHTVTRIMHSSVIRWPPRLVGRSA